MCFIFILVIILLCYSFSKIFKENYENLKEIYNVINSEEYMKVPIIIICWNNLSFRYVYNQQFI